jgi:hypothetical protein
MPEERRWKFWLKKKEQELIISSSFIVLSRPSVDWMMPTHSGKGRSSLLNFTGTHKCFTSYLGVP